MNSFSLAPLGEMGDRKAEGAPRFAGWGRGGSRHSIMLHSVDLLQETEALQTEEVRRRLASRTGKTVPNERVMAWLDTWGLSEEIPPPQRE